MELLLDVRNRLSEGMIDDTGRRRVASIRFCAV
jgi:hypothetical protein